MDEREFKTLRNASKENIGQYQNNKAVALSIEYINTGSFQRIADALEKMSVGFVDMQNRLQLLQRIINEKDDLLKRKKKEIILLKSTNTRLQNRLKKIK